MTTLHLDRAFPQWKAARITRWEGSTRWAAINDQTGMARYPETLGKAQAQHLARQLSREERQSYRRFLTEGTD